METEKTEEELAKITERRKEQGKKLQEMAARVRLEKVHSLLSGYRTNILLPECMFAANSEGKRSRRPYSAQGKPGIYD